MKLFQKKAIQATFQERTVNINIIQKKVISRENPTI